MFYCRKSQNEPGAYKKRYSKIRTFNYYFSKAEQYTSGRVQNVACAAAFTTLLLVTTLYLEIRVGCGRL